LVGGIVSVICLSFYFNFSAFVAGFLAAKISFAVSFDYFWQSLSYAYSGIDTFLFLLKNAFSGFIIFMVSTYQGLQVDKGPFEVPQATTKAVMNTLIYVIVFNFTVTTLFYLSQIGGVLW
jgi:phospholipid/cholesterol/gamma-HCH transport system permease protein